MRKIVLQLKMLEWRFNGLGDGTAGMFLANHHSTLGPYFGNKGGHDWPHSPFANEPTNLEFEFNQKMIEMTEIISNGRLKNVSLLDLPAFGSAIAWLDKHHRRESNWQSEINFEILKANNNQGFRTMFAEYKNLLEDWERYLMKVYRNDPDARFTQSMASNKMSNFTRYIEVDIKTFLIAIHGSQLSPSENPLPIWRNISQKLFKNLENENDVSRNGHYDRLIMECTLRRNLLKKNHFDHGGRGCDIFLPTLTSKGLCYTFNGQTPSETWIPTNLTAAFQSLFPSIHSNEYYHGAGQTEGKV